MEEHILRYADIDTRRALGVYRRLPLNEFIFRPIPPVSFRYWPDKKMIVYTDFNPDSFEFTVYNGITAMDGDMWSPCEISSTRLNGRGDYTFCFTYEDRPFHFAGFPNVMSATLKQMTEPSQDT